MNPDQLRNVLVIAMLDVIRRVQAGARWDTAVEQSLADLAPMVPEIAAEIWGEAKGALLAGGEAFLKLAAVHVQPGYENVTTSDTAKEKVGAELAASGEAGPKDPA